MALIKISDTTGTPSRNKWVEIQTKKENKFVGKIIVNSKGELRVEIYPYLDRPFAEIPQGEESYRKTFRYIRSKWVTETGGLTITGVYQQKIKPMDPILIWTLFYNAFVMGGDVWQPKACYVTPLSLEVYKGIPLYEVETSKGVRIAEGITGALVGDSLESVKADLDGAEEEVVKKQLKDAKDKVGGAEVLNIDNFMEVYAKSTK